MLAKTNKKYAKQSVHAKNFFSGKYKPGAIKDQNW